MVNPLTVCPRSHRDKPQYSGHDASGVEDRDLFSLIQIKSERRSGLIKQNLPGGSSAVVPPDPMPNSEVKRRSADGSVGSPHVRVGHCQDRKSVV